MLNTMILTSALINSQNTELLEQAKHQTALVESNVQETLDDKHIYSGELWLELDHAIGEQMDLLVELASPSPSATPAEVVMVID
ncbi:hypothetical protein [Shewanella waksmanii]|uniref:hypothetical protein n=1 Tax=Shewanella waksmanii TaxID=213783 RepID=UPI00373533B5